MPPRTLTIKMRGLFGGTAVKTTLHDEELDALYAALHGTKEIDACAGCGLRESPECALDCLGYDLKVQGAWDDVRQKLIDVAMIAEGHDFPSLTTKPDKPLTLTNPTRAVGQIAQWVDRVAEMDTYTPGTKEDPDNEMIGCSLGADSLSALQALLPVVEKHLRFVEKAFRKEHSYPPVLGIPME